MTEEYVSDAFIYMRERHLPYPVFDADNHMYENTDALTKFVPPEFEGIVKYVEINNRTKVAFKDKISDFIPNPTFARVAPPGGSEADPQHRRGIPSVDAFFDPEPRLALMKDMGIDRSLSGRRWPPAWRSGWRTIPTPFRSSSAPSTAGCSSTGPTTTPTRCTRRP